MRKSYVTTTARIDEEVDVDIALSDLRDLDCESAAMIFRARDCKGCSTCTGMERLPRHAAIEVARIAKNAGLSFFELTDDLRGLLGEAGREEFLR